MHILKIICLSLVNVLNMMLNLNYSIKHKAKEIVKKSFKVPTWERKE